jgi:hypothetical protein
MRFLFTYKVIWYDKCSKQTNLYKFTISTLYATFIFLRNMPLSYQHTTLISCFILSCLDPFSCATLILWINLMVRQKCQNWREKLITYAFHSFAFLHRLTTSKFLLFALKSIFFSISNNSNSYVLIYYVLHKDQVWRYARAVSGLANCFRC